MKYFLLVLALLIPHLFYGQVKSFDELLNMYDGKRHELDSLTAKKYFEVDLNESSPKAFTDKIVIQTPLFVALSCYVPCNAGGMCEESNLRTFDYAGNMIDGIRFEYNFADCGFKDERSCILSSDTLLVICDQSTEGDCDKDTIYRNKVEVEYIRVGVNGKFSTKKKDYIDTRRNYYFTSCSILNDKYLKSKSKEQLAEMRNEIFAAHGYIFNKKAWKDFFETKAWYKPRYHDVINDLTLIEKKNIDLLLKYEKN